MPLPTAGKELMDLDQPATRRDLLELKEATRRDLYEVRDELRRHFDVVAEASDAKFANLFDWIRATTESQGARLDRLEQNHGARLDAVELRLTHLEHQE